MTSVHIVVLGEPEPWRTMSARNGRHYSPKAMTNWQTQVAIEARRIMAGRQLLDGPLSITLMACLPIPASWSRTKRDRALHRIKLPDKRPDLTNLLKAAEDACSGIVYNDDRQICSQNNMKVYDSKPRLEITINEIIVEI